MVPTPHLADCTSGACAFQLNGKNAVCCPSTHVHLSYGSNWCTELALGEGCASDWQCASGNCYNNKCAAKFAETGKACAEDSQCASGACSYWEYGESKCCRGDVTEKTVKVGEYYYCAELDNGASCSFNQQCRLGSSNARRLTNAPTDWRLRPLRGRCVDRCWNNVCSPPGETGEGCSDDGDCSSKNCAWGRMEQKICCPGPDDWKTDDVTHYYCTNQPTGIDCAIDWQCLSRSCTGNVCT